MTGHDVMSEGSEGFLGIDQFTKVPDKHCTLVFRNYFIGEEETDTPKTPFQSRHIWALGSQNCLLSHAYLQMLLDGGTWKPKHMLHT